MRGGCPFLLSYLSHQPTSHCLSDSNSPTPQPPSPHTPQSSPPVYLSEATSDYAQQYTSPFWIPPSPQCLPDTAQERLDRFRKSGTVRGGHIAVRPPRYCKITFVFCTAYLCAINLFSYSSTSFSPRSFIIKDLSVVEDMKSPVSVCVVVVGTWGLSPKVGVERMVWPSCRRKEGGKKDQMHRAAFKPLAPGVAVRECEGFGNGFAADETAV